MGYAALLDAACDIYTPGSGGAYTVKVKSALPSRLSTLSGRGAPTGLERAELASLRMLYWPPDYAMPERCQIEIASERWNPLVGSFQAPTRGGVVLYRACLVERSSNA